ncbi:MAG: glycoside hydrolase family 28 protein [Tannerellaceae bacterium]|nr:glycoside hydrolase family 28 protein [Tannerellaceae bacterium]
MKNYLLKSRVVPVVFTLALTMGKAGAQNVPEMNRPYESYFENVPFEMEVIAIPQFPDRSLNILETGAVGDGLTDNTEAINNAIRQVAAAGGGRVIIPSGIWLTGPITLLDNIDLHAEANALVIFSPDPTRYPIIDTSFEGLNTRRSTSPLNALRATNIALTGQGIYDGSGEAWRFVKKSKMTDAQWKKLVASGGVLNDKKDTWYPSRESLNGHLLSDQFNNPQHLETDEEWEAIHHWLRPVLVSFRNCTNVLIDGPTFRNSPCWSLHPLSCENVVIVNSKIFTPWYAQNGDALDLESCNKALIANNLFDAGDDAICIKSGKDQDGRDRNEPCQNVIIADNLVLHGHGGFVVGSEMSGGVKNIYVKNCTFTGTDVGLRFKSTRGRGGIVENIWIENIVMSNIPTEPLLFDLFYSGKSAVEDLENPSEVKEIVPAVTEETPAFRNIYIKDVYCNNARRAMYFNGLPEMKISNIRIEDVVISSQLGAELVYTENVQMKNVIIRQQEGAEVTVAKSADVMINGKKYAE